MALLMLTMVLMAAALVTLGLQVLLWLTLAGARLLAALMPAPRVRRAPALLAPSWNPGGVRA